MLSRFRLMLFNMKSYKKIHFKQNFQLPGKINRTGFQKLHLLFIVFLIIKIVLFQIIYKNTIENTIETYISIKVSANITEYKMK